VGEPAVPPPPSASQQPGGYPYPADNQPPPYREPSSRPATVTAGCVMAWIGGAIGLLGGIALGALPSDAQVFERFDDPEAAASTLRTTGYFYAAWCVVVLVLAVLAFLGRRWAAVSLLVMAGALLLLTLFAAIQGQPTGLWSGLWSLLSALLIYRIGDSKAWFDRMAARSPAG
jgi:hypothetical protein